MWIKVGIIGILVTIIIPLFVVVIVVNQIRFNENQKILQSLQKKNKVTCVEVDEYFNTKNSEREYEKLNLLPFLSRIKGPFSIYSFNYETGSHDQTRIVYNQDLPKEYSFDFSKNALLGLNNQLYVLSQEMCPYANGICKQGLFVHQYDELGVKGKQISIPKQYQPIVKKELESGILEGGFKGTRTLERETEDSVHINSIVGVFGNEIIFNLSKGVELLSYDTQTGKWQETTNRLYQKVNDLGSALSQHHCVYYPSESGSYIFLKEGFMALMGK